MTSAEASTGVPFTLNGRAVEANPGELLIDAAERHGVHIPRFCYHSRMSPVGVCRMCLVEVDGGRGPALTPSCMVPVSPDMLVETESEASIKAQEGVLELLLINHPLDCPVCDKGGECPLQDNVYDHGAGESRFTEDKRTYEKPIPVSDLVFLDRERCILCDRCTRFADEVAGDPLIHFMGRGGKSQVNTFPGHPFSSYFSGNVVQVCPVGALTAKPYRFKARPWDLVESGSTSMIDGTGARTELQSSRNKLVRILGVDSDEVNWGWLSDKERFAYEANNSSERLLEPLVREGDKLAPARWNVASSRFASALGVGADKIGVIGGARMALEGQYAWAKLLKGVAGIDSVDAQLGDGLPAELVLGTPRATIAETVEPGSVVVIIGSDLKEELPTLFLRLRHGAINDGVSIIELSGRATSLSPNAGARLRCQPGTAGAVAAALAEDETDRGVGGVSTDEFAKAHSLLRSGRTVNIIAGRSNLAEDPAVVADAVAQIRSICPDAKLLPALRRGNLAGAMEMGLVPGFMPGGRKLGAEVSIWPTSPSSVGLDARGILDAARSGEIKTLVLLGADPLADFPDRQLAEDALSSVDTIVAVDCFANSSSERADVILPATMPGEVDGSFLNLEGRISPLSAQVSAPGQARDDWMIAVEVAGTIGAELGFTDLEEIQAEIASAVDSLAGLADLDGSPSGTMAKLDRTWSAPSPDRVTVPPMDNYGLRLLVDRKMWDEGTMVAHSASLSAQAGSASLRLNQGELDRLGVEPGDRVKVESPGGSAEIEVSADATLPRGVARIPYRLPGFDPGVLIDSAETVIDIRVTVGK